MISGRDLFSPLNEAEYEQLDEFLLSLENDEGIICLSELDGFFTAIVSGPITIPPSQWLESIWGNPDASPQFEDEAEFQRVFELLLRHMNSTADTLMEAPMEFEPLFMERIVEDKRYTIVDEWCEGYMKGVALCPDLWDEMPSAQEDYLAPMRMFASENSWQQLEKMNDMEIEFWQGQIEPAARRIHAYWLEQRRDIAELGDIGGMGNLSHMGFVPPPTPPFAANDEPFMRSAPKVGRNEPCPCGSGKKYKKCCGLH